MKLYAAVAAVCLSVPLTAQVQLGKGVSIGGSGGGGATAPATTLLYKGNNTTNGIIPATPGTDYIVPGTLTLPNIGPGASPSGLFDFSAATHLKLPIHAGYTAAASGEIGYNSTDGNIHFNISSTDLILLGVPSASLPTNGHCAQFTLIGAWWELTDAGAACGSGSGGGLSGQTAGFAVEAATGTTATGPFPMDDSVTTANTITAHKAFVVNDGTGAPGCISLGPTQICITAAPYNASGAGLTTTTNTSTFAVGTSGAVGSCSTFRAGNGVLITGAGASGANYIGTVVTCTGTTLTITPATSTSVASGHVVQHDETAAILAAMAALQAAHGGTIWFPGGVYLANGPLLDTSGANAVLPVPSISNCVGDTILIGLRGYDNATGYQSTTQIGSILQTSQNSGNFIGGFNISTGCTFPGFTNVRLDIEDMTLRGPSNPGITMLNQRNIESVTNKRLQIDTGPSGAAPSNTAGVALALPLLADNPRIDVDNIAEGGFYTAFIIGEHARIGQLLAANTHDCYVFDNGPSVGPDYPGNSSSVAYIWAQGCTNFITAGTFGGTFNIAVADMENTLGTDIVDPGNLLHGIVNYNKPSFASPNAIVTGGANVQINNLRSIPQFAAPTVTPLFFAKVCGDISSSSGCVPTASTVVYDASGNGNNGTWNGTQSGTTNWYSASTPEAFAGTFDGSTNFIQTPFTPASISSFTVAAWIKTPSNPAAQFPLSTRTSGAANGIFLLTTPGTGGNVNILGGFNNASNLTLAQITNGLGTPGTWHCVVMTHVSGATFLSLYVDGTAGGSMSNTAATNPGNAGPLYIGQDGTNTTLNPWTGNINDVRFYNTVLAHGSISGCI